MTPYNKKNYAYNTAYTCKQAVRSLVIKQVNYWYFAKFITVFSQRSPTELFFSNVFQT